MSEPSPSRAPGSPFWRFSLRLYGRPGVPAACIALQEGAGADVNVLLFCLFAAHSSRRLDTDDVRQIAAAADPWKAGVVMPLRAARMSLRAPALMIDSDGAAALRRSVKQIELEAERLQQEGLFKAFDFRTFGGPASEAGEAARQNMAALEQTLNTVFDRGALGAILAAFDKPGD